MSGSPDGAKALAEAVKKARYDLRLRQEDVEERGGPSTATLRNIESGRIGAGFQTPRPRTLRALDDSLGWAAGTAAALFEGRATEAVTVGAQPVGRRTEGDTYTVRVHIDHSGGMWAAVAELPGCFAAGSTWAELGESIGAGIDLYTRASEHMEGGAL